MQQLDVVCSPTELPAALANKDNALCMVIDVIRATTSLTVMGESGVAAVYIAPTAVAAHDMVTLVDNPILVGEVFGLKPDGFDLGNSPAEIQRYTPISGRNLIFVTTNGTKTVNVCRTLGASSIIAASLRNALAVATYALEQPDLPQLVIACAGRDDRVALDDLLTAGIITELIVAQAQLRGREIELTEGAGLARHLARTTKNIVTALETSSAGRSVIGHGLGEDIAYCAATSVTSIIPAVDMTSKQPVFHFIQA